MPERAKRREAPKRTDAAPNPEDRAKLERLVNRVDQTMAQFAKNRGEAKDATAYSTRLTEAFELALNGLGFTGARRQAFRRKLGAEFGKRAEHARLPLVGKGGPLFDAETRQRMVKDAAEMAATYDPEEPKEEENGP